MSNGLIQHSLVEEPGVQPLGQGYNYEILEEDTREFVLQKTDETHGLLKRTAQNIIKIGKNLKAVKEKLPHGHYLPWLKAEFEMSERQALNFTRVATRFENKSAIIADLSPTIIYELAAPSTSDEIVEGVISGEIDPTLEAIRAEKEQEKKRAEKSEEEAKRAKEETKLLQRQLRLTEEEAEFKVQTKDQQLARINQQKKVLEQKTEELEQKLETLQKPETVYATPQHVLDEIKALKAEILDLKNQKKLLSDEAKRLTEELWKQNDANEARRRQERREFEIKDACKKHTDICYQSLGQYVAQKPMPKDTRFYSEDEWARYDQIEEALKYALEVNSQIKAMRYSNQIIESTANPNWMSNVIVADTTGSYQ